MNFLWVPLPSACVGNLQVQVKQTVLDNTNDLHAEIYQYLIRTSWSCAIMISLLGSGQPFVPFCFPSMRYLDW